MERTKPVAVTVSLINMKGGVGKTTIASQLAHAADRDMKVLAVDLDPQSNLRQSIMGIQAYVKHPKDNRPTIAQIFEEYIPAEGDYGSARPIAVDDVIVKKAGNWPNSTEYSASYPRAAREGASLAGTPHSRWYVIAEFKELKEEIFARLGIVRRTS